MHENSELLFRKYAKHLFCDGMNVLEIGPDKFPSTYREIVDLSNVSWDTLDIRESKHLTFSGSQLYSFPIASNTYDVVLSGQVIEHVPKIWLWLKELARVTKLGGLIVTINPVSWPYHEAPVDCWRIYPEGMKAICEEANLSIEEIFCGSLELPRYSFAIPGRSPSEQGHKLKYTYFLAGLLGFPVEKSFDTITIARKIA